MHVCSGGFLELYGLDRRLEPAVATGRDSHEPSVAAIRLAAAHARPAVKGQTRMPARDANFPLSRPRRRYNRARPEARS